jgi:hypothetical protein
MPPKKPPPGSGVGSDQGNYLTKKKKTLFRAS